MSGPASVEKRASDGIKSNSSKEANKQNLGEEDGSPPSVASITSRGSNHSGGGIVKWLYPGAPSDSSPSSQGSMDSMATDRSIPGSSSAPSANSAPSQADGEAQEEMQAKTSSSDVTTPGSDAGSIEDLPEDDGTKEHGVTEDISQKVTASANYLGSFLSSAWSKTAKTANDATTNSSSFLTSAFTKVTGNAKASPKDDTSPSEGNDGVANQADPTQDDANHKSSTAAMSASTLFSSAFSSFGFSSTKAHEDKASGHTADDEAKDRADDGSKPGSGEAASNGSAKGGFGIGGFSSAISTLGKVAADATQTIKEKVGTKNMLTEFNKEQDSFIKSKSDSAQGDVGVAPWVGYQGEEELKAKIISLSEDRRNFVRAPPSGVSFEFEYSSVSSVAMALLQEDDRLQKMRYELVPKIVKEEEFWRNYFYRVNLIKQSFELKDLERSHKDNKLGGSAVSRASKEQLVTEDVDVGHDHDDEFVSDSYQASTSDIAEVDESMKKLGVVGKNVKKSGDNPEEWEAELEGELQEFEVVNANKEDNPEWENQIQEMLDAEDSLK